MTNQSLTSSSNVPLPKQFGGSSGYVLVQVTYRKISNNIELGSRIGFHGEKPSILVAALQFVGLFGNAEIRPVSIRK